MAIDTTAAALGNLTHRLRYGPRGRDQTPQVVANVIDDLARQRHDMAMRLVDLEAELETPVTQAGLRSAYVRGWRACQAALAAQFEVDPELVAVVLRCRPDFAEAGHAARDTAA
jgi:hypothetical protein